MGELAVALAHVEAVAHYEVGRDLEAHVAQVEVFVLAALAHQQGAHFQAGRVAGGQVLAEVVEGQAAVDDVLNKDYIALPARSRSRSLTIRTTPLVRVELP